VDVGLGTTLVLTAVALIAGFVDAIAGGGGLLTCRPCSPPGCRRRWPSAPTRASRCSARRAATAALRARRQARAWRRSLPVVRRRVRRLAGRRGGGVAARHRALKPLIIVLLCVAAVLVLVPRPRSARPSTRPLLTATAIALTVIGAYDGFFGPGTGTL
jgi:hypothetical protein